MHKRAARFAGVQRSHTPTLEDPFVLDVVDEVGFLTAMIYQHAVRGADEAITNAIDRQLESRDDDDDKGTEGAPIPQGDQELMAR